MAAVAGMKLLDRHIGKAVVQGTLLALLIVLCLDLFFVFVAELNRVGQGDYGFSDALLYVLLILPRHAVDAFPTAALLGSLLGMGELAVNSELVAIRAAGVSIARLTRSVLQAGVVMAVAMLAAAEWVAVPAERLAVDQRSMARFGHTSFVGVRGVWVRDGRRFVNIGQIQPGNRLAQVRLFELDEDLRLRTLLVAPEAEYQGDDWVLRDVRRALGDDEGWRVRDFPVLAWKSLLAPEIVETTLLEPDRLALGQLRGYIDYLKANELDAGVYELAFWQRIVAPFSSLVMLLLSIPFVFGPLRRAGAGQRLLAGILVGLAFFLLNRTLGHLGQIYGFNPLASALAPTLIFLAPAVYFVRRVASGE